MEFKSLETISDALSANLAAQGVDYDGTPTLTTAEMKGYWEQCTENGDSVGDTKMWVWLGGEPSDTLKEQTKTAAFGALVGGTAQGTQIGSRWNLHGTRNLLSIILADSKVGEEQDYDTLSYTYEVSKTNTANGTVYTLKVIYSYLFDDQTLRVGQPYYFKSASMGSSVQSALEASGITV